MIGSLVMLIAGYLGEAGLAPVWPAFIIGMLGWFYILYEIFAGEAGRVSAEKAPAAVQSAFGTMRLIVTIGWAIYPLGYFLGYLSGGDAGDSAVMLNVVYNVADVVNKIAFVGIIWAAANAETK
jgi:bacteriorhodopsin